MNRIIRRVEMAGGSMVLNEIEAPKIARVAQPGQFVILITDEKGERLPFTISGWDAAQGTVDFVYIEVGKTTRQLGALQPGDTLAHFVGPLGKPAEVDHYGHVLAVASGYGAGVKMYLRGPWVPDAPTEQGYQLRFTPAEVDAAAKLTPRYRGPSAEA